MCEVPLDEYSEHWEDVKGKPERFKRVLFHYSNEKKDFSLAIQEWRYHTFYEKQWYELASVDGKVDPEEGDDSDPQSSHCICSQHIMIVHVVQHRETKIRLPIGSECINKFLRDNEDIYDKMQKNMSKIRSRKRKRKQEEKARFEKRKRYRQCLDCSRFNIPKTAPYWKIRCFPCWKLDQESKKRKRNYFTVTLYYEAPKLSKEPKRDLTLKELFAGLPRDLQTHLVLDYLGYFYHLGYFYLKENWSFGETQDEIQVTKERCLLVSECK